MSPFTVKYRDNKSSPYLAGSNSPQLFVNMELGGRRGPETLRGSALVTGFTRVFIPIAIYVANFFIVH